MSDNKLEVEHYNFKLVQWSGGPPWINFEFYQTPSQIHRIQMRPENFRILLDWLNSLSKNYIKTEKEMLNE